MKIIITLVIILLAPLSFAQNSAFNSELAKQLGADDYGMKKYVLVTLVTGEQDANITDKEKRSALFSGHFSNMSRLAEEGLLVLAGPLLNASPKRGIFVFNVTTLDQAKELVDTDPAVAAGIFDYEMVEYYGSAALMQINDIHKTLQKNNIEG